MTDAEKLADRDARMKREGAIEALRGLPKASGQPANALSDYWWCKGWNKYRESVHAAIAALETPGTNPVQEDRDDAD